MSLHVEWMKRFDKFRFHKLGEIRGYKYAAMKSIYLLCRSFFFALAQQQFDEPRPHVHLSWESAFRRENIAWKYFPTSTKATKSDKKKFSVTFCLMWRLYMYVFCCCFYLIFAERTNAATTELKRMKLYSNLMESFVCDISCVSQKQLESFAKI